MKHLCTTVLLSVMLISISSHAQNQTIPINEPDYNKPKMFGAYPALIPINLDVINALLNSTVGASIDKNLSSGPNFRFTGNVVSVAHKYENTIITVVVRSTNFAGARMTISKVTKEDGSIFYTGRIISMANGDLYELKLKEGVYAFVKRNFYDLVNE